MEIVYLKEVSDCRHMTCTFCLSILIHILTNLWSVFRGSSDISELFQGMK